MFIFSFLVSCCLYKEYGAQEITATEENSEFLLAGCFMFPGKTLQWCLLELLFLSSDLFPSCAFVGRNFEADEFPSDSISFHLTPCGIPELFPPGCSTMAGLR